MLHAIDNGQPVPAERIAPFADSRALLRDPAALRARFAADGYLFLPGALPVDAVAAARAEVAARLFEVDELDAPPAAAIASGRSRRSAPGFDRGAFWESVSTGPRLRALSHGDALRTMLGTVLGAEPIAHDFIFLRAAARGRATGIHYDHPFFGHATENVVTTWVPLGDVPLAEGPLFVVEGSNRFDDLIAAMRQLDIVKAPEKKAAYAMTAVEFARSRGTRLLTADFRAGDVLLLGMFTAHGAFDNVSPANRVRLSFDIRYQPAHEPRDGRYFGARPGGTTGAGYAELNGARPLLEAWHVR